MTEKQILDYTRALYCNSTGDYYSWRNKKRSSNGTTIINKSNVSIGFTKEQLDSIIKAANGKSIKFIIGDKSYNYDSKTKFNEDLIFFYDKGYKLTYIYPLGMITFIKVYD